MQDWKRLVLCPRCGAIHSKRKLRKGEAAYCAECGQRLLRSCEGVEYIVLAFSFSALIFFFIANLFGIVSINIGGMSASMRLLEAIVQLFKEGYVLIAFFSLLVLELYPLVLMVALSVFGAAMVLQSGSVAKKALLLIGSLESWSMVDIFFVSILVAMVKVYEYAQISFGIAFWSMAIFVAIEIYLVRYIGVQTLWEAWERRFETR